MPKVVFDTNIFVSGHFWKGPPYRCLLAAEARLASLIVSEPILSKLREKLTDKFGIPGAEVAAIVDRLGTYAETVPVLGRSGWVVQDPDDDKFIDAARSGEATIIVSGDRHLLALGRVEEIEILTARQFLDRLARQDSCRDAASPKLDRKGGAAAANSLA